MTNWCYSIDIQAEWEAAEASGNSDKALGELVSKIIQECQKYPKFSKENYLQEIVDNFQFFIDCQLLENLTVDDFDNIMADFYDWADTQKVWIKTF